MSKQSLLLVDGDTRSLRVLEVSLRKAGFSVTPAHSVQDALDKLELHAPDLILSETTFPDGDGFELRRRVGATPDWADIPFVFLTASAAIENKIRGLKLGVDDYLTKPIYIKEIVTRINILLQKRQRTRFEERRDGRTRFAGRVADMPVVDVIQTIEISRKSGVIQFTGDGGRQGAIYFRDGKVIDAEADALQGEDAVYRLLTWSDGEFEVVFRTVRRREAITTSSQGLLMEGMRRLDEWTRLLEQLPPLTHRFEVDTVELVTRLGEVPDDNNLILRLIDGKRTLNEVIDACEFGDLECLQAISRLFFEGLLLDLDHGAPVKRTTGQPMPLVALDDESPFQSIPDVDDLGDLQGEPAPPAPLFPPPPSSLVIKRELELEQDISVRYPEDEDDDEPRAADDAVTDGPGDAVDEDDAPSAHALLGSYRPSSLMLIDAAVAAAQAIEPGLFEAEAAAGAVETARRDAAVRAARESDDDAEISVEAGEPEDDSIPHAISADEPSRPDFDPDLTPIPGKHRRDLDGNGRPPRHGYTFDIDEPTPRPGSLSLAPRAVPPTRREDLRMIGSLGRDRAEASGELAPPGAASSGPTSMQRELVTILPRRSTRELPITSAVEPPPLPPSDDADLAAPPSAEPPSAGPLEPPDDALDQEMRHETESGAHGQGVSYMTVGLLLLAVVLAGAAVYLRLQRTKPPVAPPAPVRMTVVPIDNGSDARPDALSESAPPDAAIDARAAIDAAVALDAAIAVAPHPDTSGKQAHDLMDQAGDAIKNGQYDSAVALADQSLRLRRTARTYLLKATALQKLDRNDEALVAIDEAIAIKDDWAPAWEQRGRLLWSMHRYDEGRTALQRALVLDPSAKSVSQIQHMLAEPR